MATIKMAMTPKTNNNSTKEKPAGGRRAPKVEERIIKPKKDMPQKTMDRQMGKEKTQTLDEN